MNPISPLDQPIPSHQWWWNIHATALHTAQNPATPTLVLQHLVYHPCPQVRTAARQHPQLPAKTRWFLRTTGNQS